MPFDSDNISLPLNFINPEAMATETFATIMVIILCWIVFLVLDTVVCGVLNLTLGIAFRKAFLRGLISLALPPIMVAYGVLIERNTFKVKEVSMEFTDLPEGFDGYRIAHISDIHARSFQGRKKHIQKAADIINGLKPDMIAFTGDLVSLVPGEIDSISQALAGMKAPDGIISVLGNHDYCTYNDVPNETKEKYQKQVVEKERKLGWDLLLDENRIIRRGEDSIAVVGVENTSPSRHFFSKGDLKKASEGTEGMFRIVLSHDPMHWETGIAGNDYPLTLSGHTHAMQFSILGWSPSRLIFKHNRGLYKIGNQYLYVNPGLGETIFPARIGVRPEITLITLRHKP